MGEVGEAQHHSHPQLAASMEQGHQEQQELDCSHRIRHNHNQTVVLHLAEQPKEQGPLAQMEADNHPHRIRQIVHRILRHRHSHCCHDRCCPMVLDPLHFDLLLAEPKGQGHRRQRVHLEPDVPMA